MVNKLPSPHPIPTLYMYIKLVNLCSNTHSRESSAWELPRFIYVMETLKRENPRYMSIHVI